MAHLVAYFVASFLLGALLGYPWWAEGGRWMMFTYTAPAGVRVEGEALIDGGWVPFDGEELFTTKWGSGLRYSRQHKNRHVMEVVSASACNRHPATPERVRFKLAHWDLAFGSHEPAGRVGHSDVMEWTCGDRVDLADGRVLQ